MIQKLASLLLIALMLAVPLRAVAGVALPCMMAGHGATTPADMPKAAAADHCHDEQPCDEGRHAHPAGCKLCGDCCLGSVSIPVSVRLPLADPPSSDVLILPFRAYASFMPDGPERPPRSTVL